MMEDANKIGMMRKMTRKDGYGKRREGSCGKFIECELWSPSDSRNWLRFEFEMEDWDSQCGGAQFRYDTIRLPSPHPGKVNATTARYIYYGLENMILILEKSMSKLYLLSMWLWKEGSLRAKRSKIALWNRNDRIFPHLIRFFINSHWASRSAGLVFLDTVLVPLGNKESDKWIAAKLFYFQSLCLFFRQNNF